MPHRSSSPAKAGDPVTTGLSNYDGRRLLDAPLSRAMRSQIVAAACLFVLANAAQAAAPSIPPPGAASCTGCHAASAKLETNVPRLAGRNPAEIVAAMEAFRSGQKPATVMDRIAKGFSAAETRAIAEWLGTQK
jgi:sulfide dehydrogenase cytochrome subunit